MEKLWYNSTLVAGVQAVCFKYLEIKANPESCLKITVCIDIE